MTQVIEEQEKATGESRAEVASRGPLPPEMQEQLAAPLPASRVKERQGPGGRKLSYIEAHEAIRTANDIFGFGGWGHRVVVLDRIGEVEVTSRNNKPGIHLGYVCVVELTITGAPDPSSFPQIVSGVGYGDATEYGPAAKVTATELAVKEAESDALKRALKNYGDQFGLALYEKDMSVRRVESDAAGDQVVERQPIKAPQGWPEIIARLVKIGVGGESGHEEAAKLWMEQTAAAFPEDQKPSREVAGQRWAGIVIRLEEELTDHQATPKPLRLRIQEAIAEAFGGIAVEGPPWKMPGDTTPMPSREEWLKSEGRETGDDIPF